MKKIHRRSLYFSRVLAAVLSVSLCLGVWNLPTVRAAGLAIDAAFSDWEGVSRASASGNLSEVAVALQGDYVYVYAREGDTKSGSISWGQQLAFVTADGTKLNFNTYQTSYGWHEAHTLQVVDGSGRGIDGASGMGAYLSDSDCYEWEMRFPVSWFGDAAVISLTNASGQQVYVKDVTLQTADTTEQTVTTQAQSTTQADTTQETAQSTTQSDTTQATTQTDTTQADATKDVSTTAQSAGNIVIDGYYEDWEPIDQENALTWYSNNKLCHHKAGIYMDEEYVYVHVKMNDLYTSQIPLTDFHLKVNGEQDVAFSAQYQNADGSVDWSGNIYNLPVGITQLAVFYTGYPKYNLGDLDVTIYNDKHTGDEFEFRVSLELLSKLTGIPEESIKSVSFNCNNIGGNSISTSGTSTGAALGIGICLLTVGVALYRKKRKRVQE